MDATRSETTWSESSSPRPASSCSAPQDPPPVEVSLCDDEIGTTMQFFPPSPLALEPRESADLCPPPPSPLPPCAMALSCRKKIQVPRGREPREQDTPVIRPCSRLQALEFRDTSPKEDRSRGLQSEKRRAGLLPLLRYKIGQGRRRVLKRLADKYSLMESEVETAGRCFVRSDPDGTGQISADTFRTVIIEIATRVYPGGDDNEPELRREVSDRPWPSRIAPGKFCFADVLAWLGHHNFDEAIVVPSQQKKLRNVAREWNIALAEVEDVHRVFARFVDSDQKVNHAGFNQLLHELLQSPERAYFQHPSGDMWQQLDVQGFGAITFDEFFRWYRLNRRPDHADNAKGNNMAGPRSASGSRSLASSSRSLRKNRLLRRRGSFLTEDSVPG